MTSASANLVAVIAGVGPGTGKAIARRFCQRYPVVLISRTESSLKSIAEDITSQYKQSKVLPFATDLSLPTAPASIQEFIRKNFGDDAAIGAAVFNASGKFMRKPFTETSLDEYSSMLSGTTCTAFLFSQAVIPLLKKAVPQFDKSVDMGAPSLIFTGATASVRGSAQMCAFASSKFAMRALSQSLAREFFPHGIHVAHAVIDGVINTPITRDYVRNLTPEQMLQPDAIAEAYWGIHTQPRSAFTWEFDLRPYLEKW